MINIGEIVRFEEDGYNYAYPEKFLRSMNVVELMSKTDERKSISVKNTYTVVGRSEYHNPSIIAVVDKSGVVFAVAEHLAIPVHTARTNAEQSRALTALRRCIETEVDLMFAERKEDIAAKGYDYFKEWEIKARDEAYSMPHIMMLREFIEGE